MVSCDTHTCWVEARGAEIASAASPDSDSVLLDLLDSYRKLGLKSEASMLMARVLRFPREPEQPFLAGLIQHCALCEDLTSVAPLFQRGLGVENPGVDLRRALAGAATMLGQPDLADRFWGAILSRGSMRDVDWEILASFVSSYPDMPQVSSSLSALGESPDEITGKSFACRFSILRTLIEADRKRAREVLGLIEPSESHGFGVTLDLAVSAFRLREYQVGLECARRLKSLGGAEGVARSVERTCLSFSAQGQRSLPRNLTLDPAVPECLETLARGTEPTKTTWGVLIKDSSGVHPGNVERAAEDCENVPDVSKPEGAIGTFSVLPLQDSLPDCWEILSSVDLKAPHHMVQRTETGGRIHTFVSSPGRRGRWNWDLTAAADWPSPSATRKPSGESVASFDLLNQSEFWSQVRMELRELEQEETFCYDWE